MHRASQRRILEQACAAIGNICKKNRSNRCKMAAVHGPETLSMVLGRTLMAGQQILKNQYIMALL
jgi:hypothetical protein